MAKKKKQASGSAGGAPEWMVTFSDCMTLLLTFFVLLLSFASFNKQSFEEVGKAFSKAAPSVSRSSSMSKNSLQRHKPIRDPKENVKGTPEPTLARVSSKNAMHEKKILDFRNLKVFTIPSKDFFWGNGIAISTKGQRVLDGMTILLNKTPSRVVISENGPDGNNDSIGLSRAWTVIEYLTTVKGFKRDMFNITASTTTHDRPSSGRMLEITLLERNIYQ